MIMPKAHETSYEHCVHLEKKSSKSYTIHQHRQTKRFRARSPQETLAEKTFVYYCHCVIKVLQRNKQNAGTQAQKQVGISM